MLSRSLLLIRAISIKPSRDRLSSLVLIDEDLKMVYFIAVLLARELLNERMAHENTTLIGNEALHTDE